MSKILGLDLGTNSIGWAVVETANNKQFDLLQKGVHIFQEGVKIEKGIEGSKAEERTNYRSARRLKYRRKLRKISTLKVLIKHNYCPKLTEQELNDWRYKKVYPTNEEFRKWLSTDDRINKNPYYFRNLAVTEILDLSTKENRYKLGRAFYHLAQRRGFLSNRLEGTKESDGAIKKAISELTELKGNKTIGQYFYEKYNTGTKIRNQYTHREDHYLEEFNEICEKQKISSSIKKSIQKAIFYQRPLKSQKGLIGKCPFEKNKQRCSSSHPLFEEYRMLCFVNNIKIKTPDDEKLRFLNQQEKVKIRPLFYRKSKEHFDFEDIAKQLAPKNQYKFYKASLKHPEDYLFNYSMKTTVSGCPVSARFESVFGENWKEFKIKHIRELDGKESFIDIYDVWHVLYTFDSVEKLTEFAKEKLGLQDEKLKEFTNNIHLKHDYGSLSLKAIKKVLPYLSEGLIYSHAIFLANMGNAISKEIWNLEENRKIIQTEILEIIQNQNQEKQIVEVVNGLIKKCKDNKWFWSEEAKEQYKKDIEKNITSVFGTNRWNKLALEVQNDIVHSALNQFKEQIQKQNGKSGFLQIETIDERVKSFLKDNFDTNQENLEQLYHPSAIEVFKQPKRAEDGRKYLGSPMVSSVRNPMAMRALHQLRKLINELIKQDLVDENTKLNIEMSRDLKNANERKALQSWQRDRENLHKDYYARIKEHFDSSGVKREPSEADILKYQLWEEQEHKCIYTGDSIGISDFLGNNPSFDIEHTIPRSLSYDNSQQNKTLCQNKFNRDIKRNKIPTELANHNDILARIEKWKEKYEELDKQIQIQVRKSRTSVTKESKDFAIQRRHKLVIERDYWKGKYERFTMKDIPSGFKNSQMVDIGIITKYSRLYLKTLFNKVYTVKGNTVADFRKLWGLQDEYEKKARVNHIHHCIDAITIACITKQNYENLAKFYHDSEEMFISGSDKKPQVTKPWPTFTEDIKEIEKEILVSHYTPDSLPKQAKKKLRKRGKIQFNKKGEVIYQQGDTARGSLHNESYYGRIRLPKKDNNGKIIFDKEGYIDCIKNKKTQKDELFHVKRVPFEYGERGFSKIDDLEKIVDDVIREKAKLKAKEIGLKEMFSKPFYIGEKKVNPIKKVRCKFGLKGALSLKRHKDMSKETQRYKNEIIVGNDENYALAIYEFEAKGKLLRTFEPFNNLMAASYYKRSNKGFSRMYPMSEDSKEIKGKIFKLKWILKIGTFVLFYKDSVEEIWENNQTNIQKRLYKIYGFRGDDGRVKLRYHLEARPDKEQEKPSSTINYEKPHAKLIISLSKFNALVENYDFKINVLGQIEKI